LKEKLNSDGNEIYRYQQNKQLYLVYMSMEIQFLAWDWHKNVSDEEHVSSSPDDNDVFFELDCYT
jgi:hypothetical protein